MYKNLTDYIGALERVGELARVRVPVDPQFEIAELTDRESKRPGGGRALLFENTGTAFPVLTNMMGSDRRIAMALGVERLGELTERIDALFGELTSPKPSLMDKLRMLPVLEKMSRWLPRNLPAGRADRRRGPSQFAAGAPVLAARRRPLRDPAAGEYGRSGQRRAQRGDVPDANPVGAYDRNALAPA